MGVFCEVELGNPIFSQNTHFFTTYSATLSPVGVKRILLVDDVSVSGQTLQAARELLMDYEVTTFVLKSKADLVAFPEIGECVVWPWKLERL